MKEIVQKEACVARKKQHLRYQAKKGRAQTAASTDEVSARVATPQSIADKKLNSDKKNTTKVDKQDFTKLPESETQFVRKEIVYIALIALILLVFYLVIFVTFRFTGVDEWLSGLIQLKN